MARVITASEYNGPLVLRHELGHSIIEVGEEYDGATTYFGANTAPSPTAIPWAHWLTDRASTRVERSVMPFQAYTWSMLSTASPWKASFVSSGTFTSHHIRVSLSGLPLASDARILLDGVDINWTPVEDIGLDRYIYDIYIPTPLRGGRHTLQVRLLNEEREGFAQLCSMEVLEYGDSEVESVLFLPWKLL